MNSGSFEKIPLLSPAQKAHLNLPRKKRIELFQTESYRLNLSKAGSLPLPYRLPVPIPAHSCVTIREGGKVRNRKTVSGTVSVSAPAYLLISVKKKKLSVENLKIACRYCWEVSSKTGTRYGSFETEDQAPRLMRFDGVPNVRDLGGRIGMDGRRVRQGWIYRSAGLNDDAVTKYAEPSPEKEKRSSENLRMYSTLLKNPEKVKILPYNLDNFWTVFMPGRDLTGPDYSQIAELKTIPVELLGSKGTCCKAVNDKVILPHFRVYEHAVLMKEFNSPEEGLMPVGCGADYFFRILLNGKNGLNLLQAGDGHLTFEKTNFLELLPVRKGRNLLAVHLKAGMDSWVLAFGRPELSDTASLLEKRIREEETILAKEAVSDRITGYVKGKSRLTKKVQEYLVRDLGIRSDVDLRSDMECRGMKGSPAGKKVQWFHRSCGAYSCIGSKSGRQAITEIFRFFLKKKNYPVVFHCIGGQDRTGIIAFLLNGLLGVSEDELYLDWEVLGFRNVDFRANHQTFLNKFVDLLQAYRGNSVNEKIESFFLTLGFTEKEIARFREIMLEAALPKSPDEIFLMDRKKAES